MSTNGSYSTYSPAFGAQNVDFGPKSHLRTPWRSSCLDFGRKRKLGARLGVEWRRRCHIDECSRPAPAVRGSRQPSSSSSMNLRPSADACSADFASL